MAEHQKCNCHPRRKETVLTLDGGGIRGHASLLILKHIMTLCRKYEHECDRLDPGNSRPAEDLDEKLPLPCHYFDYMFGTSTGGIIAIMLGRLRMNIDDCINVYKKFGKDVFGKKRKLWWIRYNKYKAKEVESFMKAVLDKHCLDFNNEGSPMLLDPTVRASDEEDEMRRQRHRYVSCRVAVLSGHQTTNDEQLYMFRSYHNPTPPNIKVFGNLLNLRHQIEVKICDAARATSAAPTYFDPMRIEGSDFMDGGLWANNPTNWAWMEVDSMHKSNLGRDCGGTHGGILHLVSIGTGKGARRDIRINADRVRRAISLVRRSLHQMTDPEPVHEGIKLMDDKWNGGKVYKRFNLDKGLETMKLDEFDARNGDDITLDKIGGVVRAYFDSNASSFEEVARQLVDHRRDRCKPDWRRYQGLTRPGPLDQYWLEKFLWDDTIPISQPETEGHQSFDRDHELNASSPRSHHHEMPTGHNGMPELITGLGMTEHGYEMSSSPIQGSARHASEASASPPRLQIDTNSLMPSQAGTTPSLSQGRCSCSSSSRESQPSPSKLGDSHEYLHHPAAANDNPVHIVNGKYTSIVDDTYK